MMRMRGGVARVRLELALPVLGVGMGGAGWGAGGEAGDGRLKMLCIVGVEVGRFWRLGVWIRLGGLWWRGESFVVEVAWKAERCLSPPS